MSEWEQRMQMAVWSVMAAPLFVSADLRKMPSVSKSILLNTAALQINQDKLGVSGTQIRVVSTPVSQNKYLNLKTRNSSTKFL